MQRIRLLVATFASFSLAACASTLYEGRLAWGDGWRQARVTAIGEGANFKNKVAKNCTLPLPSDQRYVTVRLGLSGRGLWRTVPIPTESSWGEGDRVYINVLDCSASLVPRSN